MEKKIMFITTYFARDFEGHALIAWHLKMKSGINSLFVNGYDIINKIIKNKPCILVMDHLVWDHKKQLALTVKKLGIKLVLLPTEGYFENIEYLDKVIGSPIQEHLSFDRYLIWNETMMERIQEVHTNPDFLNRFIVSGNPRFDFYTNQKLQSSIESRKSFLGRFGFTSDKKCFTYMSTSPYQGYPYKNFYSRYKHRANFSDEKIKNIYNYNQLIFRNHAKLVADLAKANPEAVFFYKTHPSETYIHEYEQFFRGINNICLIFNENVRPFLLHSELILQRNCTTALEAWLLNRPVVQINDDNYLFQSYGEHQKYSFVLKSFEEINRFIKDKKYKSWTNDKAKLFLQNIFYLLDGKAYLRAANEINEIISAIDSNQLRTIEENIENLIVEIDKRPVNKLKSALGINRSTPIHPKNFFKKKGKQKNTSNEVDVTAEQIDRMYKKLDYALLNTNKVNKHEQ